MDETVNYSIFGECERGCGLPASNATYLFAAVAPDGDGWPVHRTILCPSIPISPSFKVSNQGQTFVDTGEVDEDGYKIVNVFDLVGRSFYPYVTDFIYEAFRHGFSSRISSVALGEMTHISKRGHMFYVHSGTYADPEDPVLLAWMKDNPGMGCIRRTLYHPGKGDVEFGSDDRCFCSTWWRHIPQDDLVAIDGMWVRQTPSVTYEAVPSNIPFNVSGAIFCAVPLKYFSVVGTSLPSGEFSDEVNVAMEKAPEWMRKDYVR